MSPGRRAFALPLLLLLLLALTLLVHGALVLVRAELEAARAEALRLEARLLAEGAVRTGVAGGGAPTPAWVRPFPVEAAAAVRVRSLALDPEWRLVEAEARVGNGTLAAEVRTGRLIWVLDPASRLGALRGIVEAGGRVPGEGTIDAGTLADPPAEWPADECEPNASGPESPFPGGGFPRLAPLMPGHGGSGAEGAGARPPGLGLLEGAELLARSARIPAGVVRPGPRIRLGGCDVDRADNWGAPSDPDGPCGDHHVLAGSGADVVLDGGEGQGVLVVAGSVELRGGARFAGLVLTGGDLTLRSDARVDGAARVAGTLRLDAGARIHGSGCAVLRALERAPGLREPVLPPGFPWLGPL